MIKIDYKALYNTSCNIKYVPHNNISYNGCISKVENEKKSTYSLSRLIRFDSTRLDEACC